MGEGFLRAALAALGLLCLIPPAATEPYPVRPIRCIVPFPAGGVTDVTARLVAQKLGSALGQQIVIENRTGASGVLGADAVAKAPSDGYTLLITTGDFLTTPTLMPPMSFDPYQDLVPVNLLTTAPLLLAANAQGPIRSIEDLVTQARAAPGTIAFSSPGTGTINHLAVEWLALEAGLKLIHVPYRGGVPAATGIASGDVPIGAVTPSSAAPFLESGKLRVVSLMTRQKPSFAAAWPTLAEQGLAVDAQLWVGLFARAHTPTAIIDKLDAEVARILEDPDVRKQLNALGTEAAGLSQAAFAARIRADAERYARVIREAGIRIER